MTFTLSGYEAPRQLRRLDGRKFDPNDPSPRLSMFKHPSNQVPERMVRVNKDPGSRVEQWVVTEAPGKFYLAGPMRGYPMFNFPAFLMAARVLTARGFEIMSPAEKDLEAGFDPSKSIAEQPFDVGEAFRWDFRAVVDCQGIILLSGWERSTGATAERLVATLSQREVYYLDEQFKLVEAPEMDYTLTWTPRVKTAPLVVDTRVTGAN